MKTNKVILKNRIFAAMALGTIAFKNAKPKLPYIDKDLMNLISDLQVGEGASHIIRSWSTAWDHTNLAYNPTITIQK